MPTPWRTERVVVTPLLEWQVRSGQAAYKVSKHTTGPKCKLQNYIHKTEFFKPTAHLVTEFACQQRHLLWGEGRRASLMYLSERCWPIWPGPRCLAHPEITSICVDFFNFALSPFSGAISVPPLNHSRPDERRGICLTRWKKNATSTTAFGTCLRLPEILLRWVRTSSWIALHFHCCLGQRQMKKKKKALPSRCLRFSVNWLQLIIVYRFPENALQTKFMETRKHHCLHSLP